MGLKTPRHGKEVTWNPLHPQGNLVARFGGHGHRHALECNQDLHVRTTHTPALGSMCIPGTGSSPPGACPVQASQPRLADSWVESRWHQESGQPTQALVEAHAKQQCQQLRSQVLTQARPGGWEHSPRGAPT
eukprot:1158092-Pelagomonas_calceolata.AAC.5